jgi:nucleoside-diphosphate-sugar epimerase
VALTTPRAARVLLTGAAGFIGSHLARLLLGEGHEVIALLRRGSDLRRLDGILADLRIVSGDLADMTAALGPLREARPDVCVHLAWRGGVARTDVEAHLASLAVSCELLRRLPDIGCQRFVSAGTCVEYRPSSTALPETAPLEPHDIYGTCKKALAEVAAAFGEQSGISVVIPRIFYVYGPFEGRNRLVASIVGALLAGQPADVTPGEQVRDYLHVEDVASALWAAAQSDVTGAVNIASGLPITIAALARRVGELVGRPELVKLGARPYRDSEPMHILADATLLHERLAWMPRFDLDCGLRHTIDWWRHQ